MERASFLTWEIICTTQVHPEQLSSADLTVGGVQKNRPWVGNSSLNWAV